MRLFETQFAEPFAQVRHGEINGGMLFNQSIDHLVPVLPVHNLSYPHSDTSVFLDLLRRMDFLILMAFLPSFLKLVVIQDHEIDIFEYEECLLLEILSGLEVELLPFLLIVVAVPYQLLIIFLKSEFLKPMRELTILRFHDTQPSEVKSAKGGFDICC